MSKIVIKFNTYGLLSFQCLTRIKIFINGMLQRKHVHVLFRNSHFTNDLNFNVNKPVRVEGEVKVDFATSLLLTSKSDHTFYGIDVILQSNTPSNRCKHLCQYKLFLKPSFHGEVRVQTKSTFVRIHTHTTKKYFM